MALSSSLVSKINPKICWLHRKTKVLLGGKIEKSKTFV
jgi:hypothetical protein